MLPTVRIGRKTSSQMNLEKSSLILVLLMVGGDCQLSTVCRLPPLVSHLVFHLPGCLAVWQSGSLSVCLSVSLTVSMSFSRAMYTHHVRAYSGATATTHYVFTHTHSHTDSGWIGKERGEGEGERDRGRQLSQWQCLLFAVCSSLPRVSSYWVLPKTHLIISFCHNNRKYDFRSQSQSEAPGPLPLPQPSQ